MVFRKVEDDKGGQKFSERGLNFLPTKYSSLNKADSWNEIQAEMTGFIKAKSDTAYEVCLRWEQTFIKGARESARDNFLWDRDRW